MQGTEMQTLPVKETGGSISAQATHHPSKGSNAPVRAPDLAELETLVACAAEGSLVAAAARLQISRPAVAKRIKNLEALAGRPLLHRGGRGVRLTDAGATLLAGARRMLAERDVLVSVLSEIRGDGPSAIAGLRDLLGHSAEASRAAQQSEARLAETERVLELVLRASATGVAISDPETAVMHEVNDAFCRFVGRTRGELLGKPATETGTWYDAAERAALIEELRRTGALERVLVRVKRPDGTTRAGETSASLISLAGSPQMLSTVDDVTEERRVGLERTASLIAYRAIARLSVHALLGRPILESLADVLPDLRRSGDFNTALLWESEAGRAVQWDGESPSAALGCELEGAQLTADGDVRVMNAARGADVPEIRFAIELPGVGHAVVLLSDRVLAPSAQALIADVLTDLATVVSAASS